MSPYRTPSPPPVRREPSPAWVLPALLALYAAGTAAAWLFERLR